MSIEGLFCEARDCIYNDSHGKCSMNQLLLSPDGHCCTYESGNTETMVRAYCLSCGRIMKVKREGGQHCSVCESEDIVILMGKRGDEEIT